MARFEHLIFVCTKARPPGSKKGSCQARGGEELLERLRAQVSLHNLKGRVRVTSSGCLDLCAKGCAVVAYRAPADDPQLQPERETWYTGLTADDAEALFSAQVLQNSQYRPRLEATRSIVSTNRAVPAPMTTPTSEET